MSEQPWAYADVAGYLRPWARKFGLQLSHVAGSGNEITAHFCRSDGNYLGYVGQSSEELAKAPPYAVAGFLLGMAIHRFGDQTGDH